MRAALDLGDDLVGFLAERVDRAADLLGRAAGVVGEALHLVGDDRESAPGIARAHRLDRGVEREDVGGLGDLVDFLRAAADLRHRRGEPGDVLGQRLDQLEQAGDLVERGLDQRRSLAQPLDRALGQQPRLVARLRDLELVGFEPGDGFLQRRMFGAQLLGADHDRMDDARDIGAADGDFAAAGGNAVDPDAPRRRRLQSIPSG